MDHLLDAMTQSGEAGWFQGFIDALKESGKEKVMENLSGAMGIKRFSSVRYWVGTHIFVPAVCISHA